MLTVQGKFERMLTDRGLSKNQAQEVLEQSIPEMNEVVEDYNISFNSPHDAYPDVIYTILFLYLKEKTLKWIIENKPQAWFRPMFENK